MYKFVVFTVLALFAFGITASSAAQLYSAPVVSSTAGVANLGITTWQDGTSGVFAFGGVHGCGGSECTFTSVEFWSGDYSIHYNDQKLIANQQNSLIYTVPVTSFASPLNFTVTVANTDTSELVNQNVYVIVTASGTTDDFIGPLNPITYFGLSTDVTYSGDHLLSNPRGAKIISETFTADCTTTLDGTFTFDVSIDNIDVPGKFHTNSPFTPSRFQIRVGDDSVADEEGLVLVDASWVNQNSKTLSTSGWVYISQPQQRAISTNSVYALVLSSEGDYLRGPATDLTVNGQKTYKGHY